jgi:hypothetical protein
MEYTDTFVEVKNFFTYLGMVASLWGGGIFLINTCARKLDVLRYLAYVGSCMILLALLGGAFLGFHVAAIVLGPYDRNITFWLLGCVVAYPFTVLPYRYWSNRISDTE